ncbi:hypothetical protein MTO96_039512, partial [Rhipicephalus appendiculatus]
MGLSASVFWTGHFLSAWLVSAVEATFAIFITTGISEASQSDEESGNQDGDKSKQEKQDQFDSTFIRVYERVPQTTRYLQNADESLVVASFAAFVTCHTFLALLVACALPIGQWAMIVAFAVYFILPFCDAEKLNFLLAGSLYKYLSGKKGEKLRTAFYPNVAFSRIIKIMGIFDDFDKHAGWDIIDKYALNMDNVTIGDMFIILLATTFILAILIAYLSNVLPWTTSRPQPLLFPVMPSYWFPPAPQATATEMNATDNPAHFEALPKLDVVVQCKNLRKVYGGFVALNNVNMTTYKTQVTILLGHNGAGKTTLMSILTGLIEPSSGTVFVSGKDVRTAGFERMGFCPQFDALFADLTVSEHLSYFGG